MCVACSLKHVAILLVFATTMSISPVIQSEEFKPSTDFKNGLIVGQAVEAKWSASLCFELLARWGGDESEPEASDALDRFSDSESLIAHLFHSAEVIHHAVTLPDSALPEKTKVSFERSLTMISDQLYKTTPDRMDASEYQQGRASYIEWLREHKKDEEMRKTLLAIYDRQIETVKILAKYRTASRDNDKTEKHSEK